MSTSKSGVQSNLFEQNEKYLRITNSSKNVHLCQAWRRRKCWTSTLDYFGLILLPLPYSSKFQDIHDQLSPSFKFFSSVSSLPTKVMNSLKSTLPLASSSITTINFSNSLSVGFRPSSNSIYWDPLLHIYYSNVSFLPSKDQGIYQHIWTWNCTAGYLCTNFIPRCFGEDYGEDILIIVKRFSWGSSP